MRPAPARASLAARAAPGDDEAYLAFIDQFLTAVTEREMMDFRLARDALLAAVDLRAEGLRLRSPDLVYRASVPMRVGISSANASRAIRPGFPEIIDPGATRTALDGAAPEPACCAFRSSASGARRSLEHREQRR